MRWTADKATEWQQGQPWYCGCNFIPSTAVNQLEMWQADSFDPATIDRELGCASGPSQPLTSGVWSEVEPVRTTQLTQSDVITFHVYQPPDVTAAFVQTLQREADRPLFLCTEFMSRGCRSTFQNCLPIFKGAGIGALCWGLVAGKTNTIFPWGSQEGASEPSPWFHDVLHRDGAPYDENEVRFLRDITCRITGSMMNPASKESANV